jgi:hypothetical protein
VVAAAVVVVGVVVVVVVMAVQEGVGAEVVGSAQGL